MQVRKFLSYILVAGIFLGVALVASAADPNTLEIHYTPLVKLPIGDGGDSPDTWTISTYLAGMYRLIIALGAAVAVLMGIVGGMQYIASGITPGKKNEAKDRISNAVIGLVIVLTSYLILNTIDPKLVKFEWKLPPISGTHADTTTATGYVTGHTTCQTNTDCANGYECGDFVAVGDEQFGTCRPIPAPAWNNDSSVRSNLSNDNITVNKPNCASIGDSNCTSVYGLSPFVISSIKALKTACSAGGYCVVEVTGGTEYWLHGDGSTDINANPTDHKPGKNVVDLKKGGVTLDNYIKSHTTTEQSGCATGTHYKIGTAVYVDETSSSMNSGPHWHVCYSY